MCLLELLVLLYASCLKISTSTHCASAARTTAGRESGRQQTQHSSLPKLHPELQLVW